MFSALVLVQRGVRGPSVEGVARTLAGLVPAAVDGLVRDVALASAARFDDLALIADHAGCAYVQESEEKLVGAALAVLKQPRIFVLRAGRTPQHGFLEELADLAVSPRNRCALMLDAPNSLLTRVFPRLSRASGLVAPHETLESAAPEIGAMARALSAPVVFRARMIGED